MAHVTGTDLQDLQFDALATSTAGNSQLPSSPLVTLNKALKTTSKFVIGAINEVNTLALGTSNAFTTFSATYNSILGDVGANPTLLTDLQKIDQNVLLALVKIYKEIHGPNLDSPIALAGDIATILGDVSSKAHVHANQAALDAVSGVNTGDQDLSGLAPLVHTHVISDVTGLQAALDAKEATLALGSAAQYYRGDKTWQTLNSDVVPEGSSNLYYTDARVATYIAGHNNGANQVAVTDATGKIPTDLIPIGAIGGLVNKGVWNAATNTPTLTATPPVGSTGWFYIVNVAGTQFGQTWGVGDWAISDGAAWLRIDNTNNPNSVLSVFGRPGPNITADSADYAAFYVSLTGSYADPAWVTSLASSKLSGVVTPDKLGTGTRDGTKFLRDDGAWETVPVPLGTVYSVGLSLPGEFTITNSPVTSTGTLTGAWASQAANLFLASPDGSAGTPSFRVIAPGDVPGLDASKIISGVLSTLRIPDLDAAKITTGTFDAARLGTGVRNGFKFLRDDGAWTAITDGTVTSVGLAAPAEFTVANSPVTSAGTLSFAWASVNNPNLVFASPAGAAGVPGFRGLVADDIPALDAAKVSTGVLDVARLGTGTADATKFLRGDGAWTTFTIGTVTSVGLALPSIFTVSNSPVTAAGTLTADLASQTANTVFAGPNGVDGSPLFRALLAADIPALDAAKITTGILDVLRIPDLDAAKIASGVLDALRIPTLDAAKIGTGVLDVSRLGTGTADNTNFLRGDGTWSVLPTSGTVTSVGLSAPAEFTVSSSPVTGAGVLGLAWASVASAGFVFASPAGAAGVPGFRGLVATDIPALDAAKITTGTFTASQIPELDAAKISTGVLATARLGTGTADNTVFLRGDGTWSSLPTAGTVTSVGLAAPAEFTVTNSPVTAAGTLMLAWADVASAGFVFASPAGAAGAPGFRGLVASDIPALDAAKITTGVFASAQIPDLDAAKIVSGVVAVARLGSGTADNTVYLRGDGSWAAIPTSGTVTSVGLSLPSIFTITNSPVTGAGTLTATLAQQAANLVFAAPDGAAGAPGFRALVAADIPDLDAAKIASGVLDVTRIPDLDAAKITTGTVATARLGSGTADTTTFLRGDGSWQVVATNAVTSVGLSAPAEFTVSNSPITSTGSLTMAWASQAANLVFAAPDGASGTPGFRALLAADIPALDAAKITTGVFSPARLGTGTADNTTFLRGDGTWVAGGGAGSVTSVGLALPAEFTVTNSPVTGAGVLTGAWAEQAANVVFAGPGTGANATPSFRTLVVADLGTGTADSTKFLRGDGTWSTTSTGVLQAVKFTASNNNYGIYSGLLTSSSTFNSHGWNVSTAATDTKTWDMLAAATYFSGRMVNDANNSATAWLRVDRSAMTATNITLTATAITLTGAVTATSIKITGGLSTQYLMADGSVTTGGGGGGTSAAQFTGTGIGTWTSSAFLATAAGNVGYGWAVTNAGTNQKYWDAIAVGNASTSALAFRSLSDTGVATTWLSMNRNAGGALDWLYLNPGSFMLTTAADASTQINSDYITITGTSGATSFHYLEMQAGPIRMSAPEGKNYIDFTYNYSQGGAPTINSISAGTQLRLNTGFTPATQTDFAIGTDTYLGDLWFSVPAAAPSYGFKWYGGTTQVAQLDGTGTLLLEGGIVMKSSLSINAIGANGGGEGSQVYMKAADNTSLCWVVTGAAVNNRKWDMRVTYDGKFIGRALYDNDSVPAEWLVVTRSNSVITHINLYGSTSFNADVTMGGKLTVSTGGADVTGDAVVSGNMTAASFRIPSGQSTQYLMADGSVNTGGSFSGVFSGGTLSLTNATANKIDFGTNGIGVPTWTSLSNGAKLVLWNGIGSSAGHFSIGIGTSHMWFCVPQTGNNFVWYAASGTVNLMQLNGADGALTVAGLGTFNSGISTTTVTASTKFLAQGSVQSYGGAAGVVVSTASAGTGTQQSSISFYNHNGGTNAKSWTRYSNATQLIDLCVQDDGSTGIPYFTVTRSGTTPTKIELYATTVTLGYNQFYNASTVNIGNGSTVNVGFGGGTLNVGTSGASLTIGAAGNIATVKSALNIGVDGQTWNSGGLTIGTLTATGTTANLDFYVQGATADNKHMNIISVESAASFAFVNDAVSSAIAFLSASRTGSSPTLTNLYGVTTRVGYNGAQAASTVYVGTNSAGTVYVGYTGSAYSNTVTINPGVTLNLGSANTGSINIGYASSTTTFAGTVTGLPGSAISSGTVAPARLGTGTADTTTFLRGDGSWQQVSASAAQAKTVWNNANGVAGTSGAWTKVTGYSASLYSAANELTFDFTNKRYTAAVAGWYMATATVMIQSTSGTITQTNAVTYYTQNAIYKNGAGVSMSANPLTFISGNCQCYCTTTTMVYMNAGDYIEHWYYTNIPSPNVYYSYNSVPFCIFSCSLLK